MILDQSVCNPHKGRPFLANDCAVALNKIMYFKYFEFVNSHFITTKNNLHFHQPSAMLPKVLLRNQVYSIWTTPENERMRTKTGVVMQPRFPPSSSVVLYYCCQWEIWGRIVGESSGSHSTKYRHCWWSVARIGLFVSFRYVQVIISSVTTKFSNSSYFTCVHR